MTTLNDIAAACNVSKTTVSRVLNQDPAFSVSEQTRELILNTAASMHYNMNRRRRPVKTEKEHTSKNDGILPVLSIGILNFELKPYEVQKTNDYYNSIFSGIMSSLKDMNLAARMEFRYLLKDSYEEMAGLDALIILGKMHLNPYHPIVANIKYKVSVDYISPENQFDSVRVDFYRAIEMAVSYFHSIGLQDIGYIGGYDYITQFTRNERRQTPEVRYLAFRDYCLRSGIDPDSRIWITDGFSSEDGYRITSRLLDMGKLPPAVIFGSDDLALGSYRAFQEHGVKIGEDISIIGIDNMPFSSFLNPPLTTINLNTSLIGQTVVYSLASQIQGRKFPLTFHTPIELVTRGSCKTRQ